MKKLPQFALGLILTVTISSVAQAEPVIVVIGLSQHAAVLKINGKYRVLQIGELSPEGIKLIAADTETAVLEREGCRTTYKLSNSNQLFSSSKPLVRIQPNAQGLYRVAGEINGFPVVFLIDTGATHIAMSSVQAEYLGLLDQVNNEGKLAISAAGPLKTYRIQLQQVKVGTIKLNHLEAIIVEGEYPLDILLGMNFLSQVEIHYESKLLELRPRR
jgi:aspartyl protease family protein